jgi:hypothetical protein
VQQQHKHKQEQQKRQGTAMTIRHDVKQEQRGGQLQKPQEQS